MNGICVFLINQRSAISRALLVPPQSTIWATRNKTNSRGSFYEHSTYGASGGKLSQGNDLHTASI